MNDDSIETAEAILKTMRETGALGNATFINVIDLTSERKLIFFKNIHLINFAIITEINCSGLGLKNIDSFSSAINLEHLKCFDNKIKEIPNFNNLIWLNCNTNRIKKIGNFPNLITLYCEYCEIETLGNLEKVEYLYCDENKLSELGNFPSLKILTCEVNKIESFGIMPELIQLVACENRVTSLDNLQFSTNLQYIDINSNQITCLRPIKFLPLLYHLSCESNYVKNLPRILSLIELFIGDNPLTCVNYCPSLQFGKMDLINSRQLLPIPPITLIELIVTHFDFIAPWSRHENIAAIARRKGFCDICDGRAVLYKQRTYCHVIKNFVIKLVCRKCQ